MIRRWLSLLLCLHVCLPPSAAFATRTNHPSATRPARADASAARISIDKSATHVSVDKAAARVSVDETATRVHLEDGRGRVKLAVSNVAGRALPARVTLELLNTKDVVVARAERTVMLRPGASRVEADLPVSQLNRTAAERHLLLWYRLRYRVAPVSTDARDSATTAAPTADTSATAALGPTHTEVAEGVVSLSEIAPELFELRVAAPRHAREGQPFRVRARAVHPVSARPVSGVRVTAVVEFDDDQQPPLAVAAQTGADGSVTLDFNLPSAVSDDEAELKVSARLGGFEQTASADFTLDRSVQFLITTDKPLYQPGQTLHVRALLLDAARRALPGVAAELEINDEEGTTVFRAPLKTSRFGVASADWPIPEGARLGDYRVRVETDEPRYDDDDTEGLARVRVSRYELPNFAVQVKPDRDYYLPGESAAVEVRAEYLFGQPVKRGRVRVVRESERRWNFERQQYDVKEGAKYEGEFDAEGRFVARLALADEHRELAEHNWSRFEDAGFAAYVTDPTTNRTEQRRFSLRVTRDPVHVYVTGAGYRQAAGLPLAFYVATSYPDGTPAECEVSISELVPEPRTAAGTAARAAAQGAGGAAAGPAVEVARALRTVKTNRYGVAKVFGPVLARGEQERARVSLRFEARDREGRAGQLAEEFWLNRANSVVRVETDKTIYAPGEPVEVELISAEEDARLHFDVAADGRLLRGETVRLRGGRARLTLPYRPEFRGRVQLAAYTTELPANPWEEHARGSRTILFPADRELKFDLRFTRTTYEPGGEASADVRVRTAAGRDAESALGVVVFDKAVEERARTDAEFSAPYGFSGSFHSFWYGREMIGGVTLRDLERLDPRRARPAGFETVAELLLQRDDDSAYSPNIFASGDGRKEHPSAVFAELAGARLKPVGEALAAHYGRTGAHPPDAGKLRWLLLAAAGIDLDAVRDPWGTPYRPEFTVERHLDVLRFVSAGADKRFGTDDDWRVGRFEWAYFRPDGERLERAALARARRAGGGPRTAAEHLRAAPAMKDDLRAEGFDFDALRDRWGRPYELRHEIAGTSLVFRVTSAGPDGRFAPPEQFYNSDDFHVWTIWTDYFAQARALADSAVAAAHRSRGRLPRDEAELREILRGVGIGDEYLRDPWGRDYYATFAEEARYADRTTQTSRPAGEGGEAAVNRTETTPVTQRVARVSVRSDGPDGKRGTADDFNVTEFSAVVSQQSVHEGAPRPPAHSTTFSAATGAITGKVLDPIGAVVAGATVTATHQYAPGLVFTTETDDEGRYTLRNLPSGAYTVRVEASAFKAAVFADVLVRAASLTQLDATLDLGVITETVSVTAQMSMVDTSSASVATAYKSRGGEGGRATGSGRAPVTTPRLRKEFPETLYWQPELLTDKAGRARLKFKLADNITTWKVSVIGSTETGELGTAEREVRAFQPFFVEHEPPRVLTEGDEISLPVTLRNYLERAQRVALDIKAEDWFTLLGPATKTAEVAAGDAARETFDLRAVSPVEAGRQRVTAVGAEASDAVEKPVRVHPDGEELAETSTQLLDSRAALAVSVPASALPRSVRAELRVYPNLMSHAVESVEAVMSRPYGCGEQVISSSYPSLLVLRHYARAGGAANTRSGGSEGARAGGEANARPPAAGADDDSRLPPVAVKARRYLRLGYERLLDYRTADGGFSYWGAGQADLALTAYAVRFLKDASELIEVDASAGDAARRWLVARQNPDGSWPAHGWDGRPDQRRAAMLTAYVARVLAERARASGRGPDASDGPDASTAMKTTSPAVTETASPAASHAASTEADAERAALARALKYLAARSAEIDEPYLIASYLLAALDGGGPSAETERAAARLRSLAREEAGGIYWALETNTPFYGWGRAGRIEATALAVQALAARCGTRNEGCETVGCGSLVAGCGLEEKASADLQNSAAVSASQRADNSQPNNPQPATRDPQPGASATSDPQSQESAMSDRQLIDGGLLFMLRNKDRYGVWLSTQATVNVLDALVLLSRRADALRRTTTAASPTAGERVEVLVNGRAAGALTLPADVRADAPLSLDLSRFVSPGENRVELRRADGAPGPTAAARLVTTYYVPWPQSSADGRHASPRGSRALRLAVDYERTRATTEEEILCRVEVERVGHGGYGMLLAEVGLPPGAEVNRASLERAMKGSGWEFSRYDVLPDRLVVYLWPRAGGTRFSFTFRPRLGMRAKSAPSQVYDYYNPEARAVVPPASFVVTDASQPRPAQARSEQTKR